MKQQIISIGGGGFSKYGVHTAEDVELSRYFLNQTGKDMPSICFLPTASADAAPYIVNFYDEFTKLPCKPTHLSLFSPPVVDIESFLLEKDAIFIGGGSTKNMLALWKEWGLDKVLQRALEKGVVVGGISAGMNCWYEECVTDSLFGELTPLKCLGILKGSACPHYDGEEKRRPSYHAFIQSGKMGGGIAIEDNAAVHYIDGKIKRVVTTKQTSAYQVFIQAGEIVEKRLDAVRLKGDKKGNKDEVRRVDDSSNIKFRPLSESDFQVMHQWFNRPHVQAYYSLRPWTIEEVRQKLTPYVQGGKGIRCFIIQLGNSPIGYIQSYSLKDHPWEDQELTEEIIQNAAGIDLFIGEAAYLDKGFGVRIVTAFLDELIWQKYKYCLADPDIRNKVSIRLFEKCGFARHKLVDSKNPLGEEVKLQLFIKKIAD